MSEKGVNVMTVDVEKPQPTPKKPRKTNKRSSIFDTIAIVYWDDACSHDEWTDAEAHLREDTGLAPIISVGFFLKETDKEFQILRSSHEDESANEGRFAIPKGMIKKVEYKKGI